MHKTGRDVLPYFTVSRRRISQALLNNSGCPILPYRISVYYSANAFEKILCSDWWIIIMQQKKCCKPWETMQQPEVLLHVVCNTQKNVARNQINLISCNIFLDKFDRIARKNPIILPGYTVRFFHPHAMQQNRIACGRKNRIVSPKL